MQLFYVPSFQGEEIFTLDKEESGHIVRVLRMTEGEEIFLTDGRGNLFTAVIADASQSHCSVRITHTEHDYQKKDFHIHLAIAPTKNISRIEWLLEKATEIGIDEVSILITEHSERKNVNIERLDRILVSAMKQSLKAYKPVLNDCVKFPEFVRNCKEEEKYICWCEGEERHLLKDMAEKKKSYTILIGPEGDFSREEVDMAMENGFKPVTLGDMRLRTETAALYAVSNIHFLNQ